MTLEQWVWAALVAWLIGIPIATYITGRFNLVGDEHTSVTFSLFWPFWVAISPLVLFFGGLLHVHHFGYMQRNKILRRRLEEKQKEQKKPRRY